MEGREGGRARSSLPFPSLRVRIVSVGKRQLRLSVRRSVVGQLARLDAHGAAAREERKEEGGDPARTTGASLAAT